MLEGALALREGRRGRRTRLALVPLLLLGGLGLLAGRQWREVGRQERLLAVTLTARSTADYGEDRSVVPLAPVGLGIVRDMIRDSQPEPGALSQRLVRTEGLLNTPIPAAAPPPMQAPSPKPGDGSLADPTGSSGTGPSGPKGNSAPGGRPDPKGTPDRPEKPEKPDRPERPDKADKSDKAGGSSRK